LEGDKVFLSDQDLKRLAEEHDLVSPFSPENCEGATIDIILDSKIKVYISEENIILGNEMKEDQYKEIDLGEDEYFLEPNQSVLVQSFEYFKIPDNMAAQVLERYSIKLLGLSISPASYMNPGYEGRMSFVAYNQSSKPIQLTRGIKFAQLAISQLSSKAEKPYRKQDAKYMGSEEVNISKLHLDHDIQEFLSDKGVSNVSNNTAKELGDYLMKRINRSAQIIADELREKFGDPT
jgi:dCTP deaminase